MKYRLIILILVILNLKIIPQNWTPLGTWSKGGLSGQTGTIKFLDNLMIFDAGRSLRLYNVENIDTPYELDAVYVPPVEDIHMLNSYILVKLSYLNLVKIFKISNENKLIYEKDIEFDKDIIDVNIINGKLFLLNSNEISIYSVDNTFNIDLDTTISCSNNQYSEIVGESDYFIMSKQSEIFIYQQNESNSFFLISSFNTGGGSIIDMKIKEGNLLLSGYHIGLRIVDINRLATPTVLSNYYLEKTGRISFSDSAAFIHDYSYEGIKIFDISNPTIPTLKSEYFVGNQYTGGNYYYRNSLFLSNYYVSRIYQLKIIDLFQPNYLQDIKAENHAYNFYQVLVYNNIAILRTNYGILFVNKNNYDELEIYSEINDIGSVSNIALYSNHLFVSAEDKILIYNIEDPWDITLVSSFTHDETISSFIIENNFIYLYSPNIFKIYYMNDFNNIEEQLSHEPSYPMDSGSFSRMIKLGDKIHLYVHWQIEWSDPNDPYQVDVIDINDPHNASYIGHINGGNYNYKLYEHNGVIYGSEIAGYGQELNNKLHVCIVANTDSVYSVYQTNLSDKIDNLYFDANFAYVHRHNHIITVDLTAPTTPIQIYSDYLNLDIREELISYDNTFYFCGVKDWRSSVVIYKNNVTSIDDNPKIEIPDKLDLQAYPNPFNPVTKLNYQLPNDSDVELTIYNLLGQEVVKLVNTSQYAGNYSVEFNGSNLNSGIYFCSLKSKNSTKVIKIILLK